MEARIDPDLAQEIGRNEEAGAGNRAIPVIIEVAGGVHVGGGDVTGELERMEGRLRALQQPVLARLEQLGAGKVGRSALVNALFASLTPAQITDIARHPDVRMVRLTRPEQVTT